MSIKILTRNKYGKVVTKLHLDSISNEIMASYCFLILIDTSDAHSCGWYIQSNNKLYQNVKSLGRTKTQLSRPERLSLNVPSIKPKINSSK